jgi:gamma-glutamyltranspeptidase/glutathione hydrolase
LLTELERRVYADRAEYLGDPDFYSVPTEKLLDTQYLQNRFADISMQKATPSSEIKEGKDEVIESFETTHFEIVDRWRNAVSITTTLNGYFGSKLIAQTSGVMLNNEMDDFSIKPGVPNQFGLVGSEANQIEAEKRMLSSMTPTIVLKSDSLVLLTGTPGGATIINTVFQTILNSLVFKMNVQQAVDITKEHSQWLPDKIYYETGKMPETRQDSLINMGHTLFATPRLGKMKLILINDGVMTGAGDTLRGDPPALGY